MEEQTGGAPWSVAVASSLILGLIVGIPYYGIPFFYDYFEAAYGWSRASMMLGLPVGTFVTLVAGPWLVPRVPPRRGIVCGAAVCAAAMAGFGVMGGGLAGYYAMWLLYMAGWTFAGPLAHQICYRKVFGLRRGRAFAVSFFGYQRVGGDFGGAVGAAVDGGIGIPGALLAMGGVMLLAVPVAFFGLPELRAHGVAAAGDGEPAFRWERPFWLLMLGSTISIAGIGGVSQHLKLIFREAGFSEQARLDAVFGWTLMVMLTAGAAGAVPVCAGFGAVSEAAGDYSGVCADGRIDAVAAVAGPAVRAVHFRVCVRVGDQFRFLDGAVAGDRFFSMGQGNRWGG